MAVDDFETIVAEHYEPLYRFALSLTRVEADACDLTQQTFYIWATKGHQLKDRSQVKSWLFTTLHRAFLQTHRRKTRFPHHAWDEIALDAVPIFLPDQADKVDCSKVLNALAHVDEVYQSALVLSYMEDYSYKEIAEILQIPMGTVRSRIFRGIAQLRQLLGLTVDEPATEPNRKPTDREDSGCLLAAYDALS